MVSEKQSSVETSYSEVLVRTLMRMDHHQSIRN